MKLNRASFAKLKGVHPDLVRVVMRCAADWADSATGFIVTCGVRTLAEQKILKAKGASKTLRSRHIPAANGFSHAVDLACTIKGQVRWDWPLYDRLAKRMKNAAKKEGVLLEWGGDWKTFKDGPHYQLPWASYPGATKGKK
jgi:peptidoglycan L-alanyl-D-glutamate endopeptidase CwlK